MKKILFFSHTLFIFLLLSLFMSFWGGGGGAAEVRGITGEAAAGEATAGEAGGPRQIYLIEMKGAVTAGQASFLHREMQEVDPERVQALLIVLDTPGGLLDATLDLATVFGTAPVPVIIMVGPSGAIAASAGAFLLVSSDIAAMSPGTTVGAAMPVALSPGGAQQADQKTINFLAGHIRSIARQQGRPEEVVERFVTENLTLTSFEALEKEVIDLMANDVTALLEDLHGWEGEKAGRPYTLSTRDAPLVGREMILREKIQDRVSQPEIAFLLLMGGAFFIYMGLGMPGTFVLEVIGGIVLLLGIYGMGLFDTNTTGIILLIVGLSLLTAEFFTSGFGILGIGGGVSLLIGSILLPHEPLMAEDWYTTFLATAIGVAIAVIALSFLVITMFIRSRRGIKEAGSFFRPAPKAVVVDDLSPHGTVKMRGELWNASSHDGSTIPRGTEVEIINQEGLLLFVKEKNPA